MKKQKVTIQSDKTTRRDAIRLAGAALASTGILTSCSRAVSSSKPAAGPDVPADSYHGVFADKCKCNNSGKYNTLDKTGIYPLMAFWLMLTTENWDPCWSPGLPPAQDCADSTPKKTEAEAMAWREGLANELGLAPEYLEYLYGKYHNDQALNDAFGRVRGLFQEFITQPKPPRNNLGNPHQEIVYGGRPCVGGATILQIAKLVGS